MSFAVRISELADSDAPLRLIEGFPTLELAREYARRRVRDSLEELRCPRQSSTDLRKLWILYGEDAAVLADDFRAGTQIDNWLLQPATAIERDWCSLTPPCPAESQSWRWLHADGSALCVTLRNGELLWQERWGPRTQPVADFRAWGVPAGLQAVPIEVLAQLANTLGMADPPWQRRAHPLQAAWVAAARGNQLNALAALQREDPKGFDRYDAAGYTPLHRALECYSDVSARWMVEHGADLGRALRGATPLLVQAAQRHLSWLVEACLRAGHPPHCSDRAGLTPLAYAVLNYDDRHAQAHTEVVARLLGAGADADFVLPGHGLSLRAWVQARERRALFELLGVADAPEYPAGPIAADGERVYAQAQIEDQHTTANGASGRGRWTVWVDLPAAWAQAPAAQRDHWLKGALGLAYQRMSEQLAASDSGGSYQLLSLRSRMLTTAEADSRPWQGKMLYRVDAEHRAAVRVHP